MARKLNKNLVALGSAAIVGVYALGYAHTQPATGRAAAATAPPSAAVMLATPPPSATAVPAATAIARAIATATATAPPTATRSAAIASNAVAAYRDGTYSGSGTSRRGGIDVDVTIQGGKIMGVQITNATTYYPISRIARLPGQVVDRQNGQVDLVSGATESTRAFRQAVTAALSQAGGASSAAVLSPAGR